MEKKVWYVCYGSNMLKERFEIYIHGGTLRYNGKYYGEHCSDETEPIAIKPVEISFNMYFGNISPSWSHQSVSFLDFTKQGKALGRAYLINENQFYRIWELETKTPKWYGKKIELDPIDGFPAFTFTNAEFLNNYVGVSDAYLQVIKDGIKETYPNMSDAEIDSYLEECKKNSKK